MIIFKRRKRSEAPPSPNPKGVSLYLIYDFIILLIKRAAPASY